VNIRKVRSGAKVVGTIVCVGGTILMTFYKGPIVRMFWFLHHQSSEHNQTSAPAATATSSKDWIIGSLLMFGATFAWSILFILQSAVLKKYPAQLSLAALICFLGTLQATVLSLALVRDPSQWALGWDINLLTAVYSGIVASAVAYYVQGLCIRVKGPVFTTAFSPLMMIIAAIMGSAILSENVYLGSVLGGVVIAIGLYAVLWGKLKDGKASTDENCSEALPSSEEILPQNAIKAEDIEAASNEPMNKGLEPLELDAMKQGSVK